MKMRRRPELMQLLSAKSMMRYGPPKNTAGLARSFVRGYSRSPAPPASTMTMASSTSAAMGDDYVNRFGASAMGVFRRETSGSPPPEWFDLVQPRAYDEPLIDRCIYFWRYVF